MKMGLSFLLLVLSLLTGCSNVATKKIPPRIPTNTLKPNQTLLITFTRNPTATITSTSTPQPSFTATFYATHTPVPTSTSSPTLTDIPLPTIGLSLTPAVRKTVIVLCADTGGDGMDKTDYYFGRGMPVLVLYDDGHFIARRDEMIYEKMLTNREVADFITKIGDAGYSHKRETLYNLPDDYPSIEGGARVHLFVDNGEYTKTILLYYPYMEYLIPKMQNVYNIFTTYIPSGSERYNPKQMVLWIEEGKGDSYYGVTPEPITEWPQDLPRIKELGLGHVVINNELIPKIMELFQKLPGGQVFRDEKIEYLVIARPLLPNESPSTIWASLSDFLDNH